MKDKINRIQNRIAAAAQACNRNPAAIKLIAVSKTVSIATLRSAVNAGLHVFGENYIQEAREKINALSQNQSEVSQHSTPAIEWHFIGHLQSNKAKYAVRHFDWIHTVDSFKLALELDKASKKLDKIQNIFLQVNISEEKSKSGVSVKEVITLTKQVSQLNNLSIKGLMTMPPYYNNPEKARPFFARLAEARDQIDRLNLDRVEMTELSMGMTGDFEVAIAEGATCVRIGTAIFGERQ